MNKLEPVIAFIDARTEQLNKMTKMGFADLVEARLDELEMIRTLCQGLIKQDVLLQSALNGPESPMDKEILIKALGTIK